MLSPLQFPTFTPRPGMSLARFDGFRPLKCIDFKCIKVDRTTLHPEYIARALIGINIYRFRTTPLSECYLMLSAVRELQKKMVRAPAH